MDEGFIARMWDKRKQNKNKQKNLKLGNISEEEDLEESLSFDQKLGPETFPGGKTGWEFSPSLSPTGFMTILEFYIFFFFSSPI